MSQNPVYPTLIPNHYQENNVGEKKKIINWE